MEFNNREIASLFWLAAVFTYAIWKAKPWSSVLSLLKAFWARPVRVVIGLMGCYVAGSIWLLAKAGLWGWPNFKTTAMWFASFALVSLFQIGRDLQEKEGFYFRRLLKEAVGINAVIAFVGSAYTFNLFVELALTAVLGLMAMIAAFGPGRKEFEPAVKFANFILALGGSTAILYSAYEISLNFVGFATSHNGREFAIPLFLTLLYLPFLYGLHVFMVYEAALGRLNRSIKNPVAREFARRKVMLSFGFDLSGLRKWLRHISLFQPASEADVAASFAEIRSVRKRERKPYRVPPPAGWLPEQARGFLAHQGFEVGDYHRSLDGWRASSNYKMLGKNVLDNNMAYYLYGTEYAVSRLTLVLNVNDPEHSEEAEQRFNEAATILVSSAVGFARGDQHGVTLQVNAGSEKIGNVIVELRREDWSGGIDGGYEIELTVDAACVSDC